MSKREQVFVKTVLNFYREHGRHALPWRKTVDPYRILVSEIMLQQTQVDRVIPKYNAFLKKFPTVRKLAQASLGEVLIAWQGLGYNRRAKMLHACAQTVVKEYKEIFPSSKEALIKLPGVGPYTAGAIMAFVFNVPVVLIETNVRSVYLHHFFRDKTEISDAELLPIIAKTVSKEDPRGWYYALMDYGSYLKKEFGNPNVKSAHHTKQSSFNGSDRQIRGAIIRALADKPQSRRALHVLLSQYEDIRIDAQIQRLQEEQMILLKQQKLMLP